MFEDLADEINNFWESTYYAAAHFQSLSVYLDGMVVATIDQQYQVDSDDTYTAKRLQEAVRKYC